MHALVGDCNLVTVGFVMMHTLAVGNWHWHYCSKKTDLFKYYWNSWLLLAIEILF